MKAFFFLSFCFFYGSTALSQQRPQLTQYMQNNFLANPAVAGIEDYGDVRTGFRTQWLGIEQAPTTFYVSVHSALNKANSNTGRLRAQSRSDRSTVSKRKVSGSNRFYRKSHHGVGALAQTDKAGAIRASTLNLSYAFHLPVSGGSTLSGGVSTGVTQLAVNRDWFVEDADDPFLVADFNNKWRMDLGLGLWFYNTDYFVGLSGTQLLGGFNQKKSAGESLPETSLLLVLQPHYYLTGGYRLKVSPELTLAPSFMLKYSANRLAAASPDSVSRQAAVDLNLKGLYAQQFWLGASYRHNDAVAAMIGIYLNHFLDVSYSYDFTISELRKVNAVSHEVVLGFRFSNPGKIICPKYMW